MKKPTNEEIIEAVILLVGIAVAVLVFSVTFVLAREILRSIF